MGDKNKKAYLFLGLGIGIVIVNIIFYMNPRIKYREMTDSEVTEKAKELGMVSIKENIKINDEPEIKVEKTKKDIKLDKEKAKPADEEKKVFVINQGENLYDVSENLMKFGYIEDDKKFNERVKERELSKKIRYGEYEISKDASFDEIINIITWRDKK